MAIPKPVPAIPRQHSLNRNLPYSTAMDWLRAGWRDFTEYDMRASVQYGIFVFVLSAITIGGLFLLGAGYILLPALSGFMIIGPALAIGLYEKSRRIAAGEPVSFQAMIDVQTKSPGQILFIGVLLSLLVLLWMRAAVLLYALFFGMHTFPGFDSVITVLFTTSSGWWLIAVGSFFGALFAAFAFAVSVFSVPMLLNESTDVFTAMGSSIVLVWNNLPVMLCWGAIVMVLFLLCLLTGLFGLIVVFPLLGHATWHAYKAIRPDPDEAIMVPAIPSEPAA